MRSRPLSVTVVTGSSDNLKQTQKESAPGGIQALRISNCTFPTFGVAMKFR